MVFQLVVLTFYIALMITTLLYTAAKTRLITKIAVGAYVLVVYPIAWYSLSFAHPMLTGYSAFVLILLILLFEGNHKRFLVSAASLMMTVFLLIDYYHDAKVSGCFGIDTFGVYIGIVLVLTMLGVCTYAFKNKYSEMNVNLQWYAITDSLTGAYNSRAMTDMLSQYTKKFKQTGEVFSIAALDMDSFKRINDQYGHGVGDDLLVLTAKTMQGALRESDLLARTGGDEFAIIMPNCTASQGKRIIQRLLNAVSQIKTKTLTNQISFSAGISDSKEAKRMDVDILRIADHKLYYSKAMGRIWFIPDLYQKKN